MSIDRGVGEFSQTHDYAENTIAKATRYQQQLELLSGNAAQLFIDSAVAELNQTFPLMRKKIFIVGDCLYQERSDTNILKTSLTLQKNTSAIGEHQGFEARVYYDDKGTPRQQIMQRIIEQATSHRIRERNVFFDLSSKTIPLKMIKNLLPELKASRDIPFDRFDRLQKYSHKFLEFLMSDEFERLNLDQKKLILDKKILKAEKKAGLRGAYVITLAKKVFANDIVPPYNFFKVTGEELEVSGRCVAVDSLANLILEGEIYSPPFDQDNHANLCLVIEPDQETKDYFENSTIKYIYVPIDSMQLLVMDFLQ